MTAGLSSDFHQMNRNTTKDRLGNFGLVMKGQRNPKDLPVVRDERADFGKATLKDDQFVTRWLHKLNEKPHTYYKNEFAKTGSSVFSPRMANTRPFGTYVNGFHGLSNDPNSTIGGQMTMLDKNQRSSKYGKLSNNDNQPVYKIGEMEHRRALSMNSSNHHHLHP